MVNYKNILIIIVKEIEYNKYINNKITERENDLNNTIYYKKNKKLIKNYKL